MGSFGSKLWRFLQYPLPVKIVSSMFNDFVELRQLRETADIVAEIEDWPFLYDEAQLQRNEVPVYAASYVVCRLRSGSGDCGEDQGMQAVHHERHLS